MLEKNFQIFFSGKRIKPDLFSQGMPGQVTNQKCFLYAFHLHLLGGFCLFQIYYYHQEMVLIDGGIKVNDRSHFYLLTVNKVCWHSPVENLLTTNRVALWEVKRRIICGLLVLGCMVLFFL